ncbi:MAG: site-specific DNA-methyltransferase [Bacteroidales bacterium]|jgi:adenine-specific DNA-methyltransferase
MEGESINIINEQLEKLKQLFPETISEGKIDWEKLQATLGKENIEFLNERYVLNWAGKSEAFKVLQQSTTATLKPVPEESVNFENSENVFIEGENLEVLKVLQKSYYGKIKCIIIDPPYNTGNDSFIYPDSFKENKEDYLKRIGEKDEEGYLLKEGFFRKNSKDSGHYHSNWLSMMYPRLFLARNLLTDDGVIFVHIDDNEVHNLRLMMNEIFGEENFVAQIVWQKKYAVANDDDGIGATHDYIIVFQKSDAFNRVLLPRTDKQLTRYQNLDKDPRGDWSSDNYVSNKSKTERPTLWYPIKHPKTGEEVWPEEDAVWRYSKENHEIIVKENRLYWGPNQSYKKPRLKRFLSEIQEGVVPSTWWPFEEVGHNDEGQKETADILGKKIFSTPKPVRLVKKIISISSLKDEEAFILDFFSGSGTTGQAVLELNNKDGGNRKFILVQLPEKCDENSEAFNTGYKTIADIGKERIRRVIKKLEKEAAEFKKKKAGELPLTDQPLPIAIGTASRTPHAEIPPGFKVFKLTPSSFKIWRGNDITEENLVTQLDAFTDPVREGSEKENMLYELILKAGYLLTDKVEHLKAQGSGLSTQGEGGFYTVNEGDLIIVLDEINQKLVDAIISAKPKKVIMLDNLFTGNDQLKTNTVLQMKDAEIDFKTI